MVCPNLFYFFSFPFLSFLSFLLSLDPYRQPCQYIRSRAAPPDTTIIRVDWKASPPSGIPHPMSNHTRTASGRTTTAAPSPTSRATFTPMNNHTQNDIRAHNLNRFRASDGHALAPSGMPHALSRAPSVPSRAPSSRYALGILPRKVVTTSRHRATLQCGGCFFSLEVCSKSQFALTVKKLTRFQGFNLRIAVFVKFSF